MAEVKTYTLTLDAQELHDLIEAALVCECQTAQIIGGLKRGRPAPRDAEGKTMIVHGDVVIVAIGQSANLDGVFAEATDAALARARELAAGA